MSGLAQIMDRLMPESGDAEPDSWNKAGARGSGPYALSINAYRMRVVDR